MFIKLRALESGASICAALTLNILYKIFLLPLVSPVQLATSRQNHDQDPLRLPVSGPLSRQM